MKWKMECFMKMTYKEARFELYEFFKMYRSEPFPEYMHIALKAMDDIINRKEKNMDLKFDELGTWLMKDHEPNYVVQITYYDTYSNELAITFDDKVKASKLPTILKDTMNDFHIESIGDIDNILIFKTEE